MEYAALQFQFRAECGSVGQVAVMTERERSLDVLYYEGLRVVKALVARSRVTNVPYRNFASAARTKLFQVFLRKHIGDKSKITPARDQTLAVQRDAGALLPTVLHRAKASVTGIR
jgi:hypothetical protein